MFVAQGLIVRRGGACPSRRSGYEVQQWNVFVDWLHADTRMCWCGRGKPRPYGIARHSPPQGSPKANHLQEPSCIFYFSTFMFVAQGLIVRRGGGPPAPPGSHRLQGAERHAGVCLRFGCCTFCCWEAAFARRKRRKAAGGTRKRRVPPGPLPLRCGLRERLPCGAAPVAGDSFEFPLKRKESPAKSPHCFLAGCAAAAGGWGDGRANR